MRRFLAPLLAALTLGATAIPAAHAVELDAPYTQAAANVDGAGNLTDGKMIIKTWRVNTGQYCVQVDPLVDIATSLVQVTPGWAGSAASRNAHANCGGGADTIAVWVWNLNSAPADSGFTLAVM
ncbi:hypothetical protein [Kitasatospora sp. McL0602]|uniref:hypothetical protein n=1 Tax=Kitasatospora sp. McL0602 TaxID=3439530 RepID=UPI003F892A61